MDIDETIAAAIWGGLMLTLALWAERPARRRTAPPAPLTPLSGLWVRRVRTYDRRTTRS